MSYQQFQQECGDCHKRWNAAFGIVGTTQIAAPPTKCPHCGSGNLIKIADRWADRQTLSVTAYCQGCADSERTIADLREQKNAIGAAISEIHSMLVEDPLETGDARTFRETLHEIRVAAEKAKALRERNAELAATVRQLRDINVRPGISLSYVEQVEQQRDHALERNADLEALLVESARSLISYEKSYGSGGGVNEGIDIAVALGYDGPQSEEDTDQWLAERAEVGALCAKPEAVCPNCDEVRSKLDRALSELAALRKALDAEWPDLDALPEWTPEQKAEMQAEYDEWAKKRLDAQKDTERLDWLECHEIPISSPCPDRTFGVGETAKFPWGAARLEEEIPNGLRWAKLDWREAIDAARAAIPAEKLASASATTNALLGNSAQVTNNCGAFSCYTVQQCGVCGGMKPSQYVIQNTEFACRCLASSEGLSTDAVPSQGGRD